MGPVPSTLESQYFPSWLRRQWEIWEELQAERLEAARWWERGRKKPEANGGWRRGGKGTEPRKGVPGMRPEDPAREYLLPGHFRPTFFSQGL